VTRRFPRARIRRFGNYADLGHDFPYCMEVSGITDYQLARRLWRQYMLYTQGPHYYD
jgi:hypothetical protein